MRVVNTRSAAMGVGFTACAAAQVAASGADLDAVEAEARSAVPRTHAFIVVHRLDNLRRSGRIGTAASWLGTALSLKPLLCLDDRRPAGAGSTDPHGHQGERGDGGSGRRSRRRARASIAVHHVDNHDGADEIGAALTTRLPQIDSLTVTDMGPVLSIHVGGGAVGVVVQLAD